MLQFLWWGFIFQYSVCAIFMDEDTLDFRNTSQYNAILFKRTINYNLRKDHEVESASLGNSLTFSF